MLITPRPGAERKNIRQVLSGAHTTAMNLQRPYLTAFEGLWTYLEWATESARMLRSQISDRDLDVLIVRIVEIAGLLVFVADWWGSETASRSVFQLLQLGFGVGGSGCGRQIRQRTRSPRRTGGGCRRCSGPTRTRTEDSNWI